MNKQNIDKRMEARMVVGKIYAELKAELVNGILYGVPVKEDDVRALVVAAYQYGRSETQNILDVQEEIEEVLR